MKKTYLLVSIVFLLMLLPLSGAFALKKKPKLKLTKAKTTFSTNIPSSSTGTFVRGNEHNIETIKEYNDLYKQIYITPKPSKVFQATPLFEWKKPVCSEKNPCSITLNDCLTKTLIKEIPNIKENSYRLELKENGLEPGNIYNLTVMSDQEPEKLNYPIEFEVLSNKDKKDLTTKLEALEDPEDYVNQINFFAEEALWFDLIDTLNKALLKNPDDKDLIDYKQSIYSGI